jgi:hypothetical protein
MLYNVLKAIYVETILGRAYQYPSLGRPKYIIRDSIAWVFKAGKNSPNKNN